MSTKEQKRSIFRTEAVERHIAAREKSIWPRFIRPRVFLFLWILFGLLLLAGVLTWFAQVPIYASGTAVVAQANPATSESEITMIAFLVPSVLELERLQVGESIYIFLEEESEPVELVISQVEPDVLTPEMVREKFLLTDELMQFVVGDAAVVQIMPPAELDNRPITTHVGSRYRVDVEIGSQRVVSLIPYLGQFFEPQFWLQFWLQLIIKISFFV